MKDFLKKLSYGFIIVFISVVGGITLSSCSEKYKAERTLVQTESEIRLRSAQLDAINARIGDANREYVNALGRNQNAGIYHYFLVLQMKQSTFSLDIGQALKNEMNAIEFPIETSESFYNQVNEGDDVLKILAEDTFKWGSFLADGDFSNMTLKVIRKEKK
jgi:hypothetical protein